LPIYLLAVIISFVLFLLFFFIYWRQVIDGGITRHFRAAELIADGYFPTTWVRTIERRLWWQRTLPLYFFHQPPTGTELALAKLDEVALFFLRNSAFVEPEAKKVLIAQLKAARFRWQPLTWEELRQQVPPAATSNAQKPTDSTITTQSE
jgi:hypothetical protein